MADESAKGVLGHLPPLPRKALNNSVIGMEQAYRQRKGLPLLSGRRHRGAEGGSARWRGRKAARRSRLRPRRLPAVRSAAPRLRRPLAQQHRLRLHRATISAEVAKWVAQGKKWSKSTIAAEQARRGRKSLPALNDAEITALLGEPAAAAPAAAAALLRRQRPLPLHGLQLRRP